jgi:transcriptional regulator with XRE-family HTH domain
MREFIFDLINARGWSIRHLAELTDISYSGIRDYLKGLPHRLSAERLSWVYGILELDHNGSLKSNTLYTWGVEVKEDQLRALNRVLRVTTEMGPVPEVSESPESNRFKFEAIPLLGGGITGLPAPYWVLRWSDIYILIQWTLPKTSLVKKVPHFHARQNSGSKAPSEVYPDIRLISSVCWAEKMDLSTEKICGIQLTHAQLNQLQNKSLELETIKDWLQTAPIEDSHWVSLQKHEIEWTWELITQRLQQHYIHPEEAAKALKMK